MSKTIDITQKSLEKEIKNFFLDDVLNFKNYPDKKIAAYYDKPQKRVFIFDVSKIKSDVLKQELKDYLYCVFVKGVPYKYDTNSIPALFMLPKYFETTNIESIVGIKDLDTERKKLIKFCKDIGIKYQYYFLGLFSAIQFTLQEFYDTRKGFERDVWYLKDFQISKERINKATSILSLNFRQIENITNRELAKIWFRYLMSGTELAFATIANYLTKVAFYCNYLKDTSILDVDRNTFETFLHSLDVSTNWYNKQVYIISEMYCYLAVKEIFKNQSPVLAIDFKRESYEHNYNSVSDYTILQIFKHLHELPFNLMLMYLINYSTGMRVSDICQLKTDCLLKSEKCYFIRYYVQKMQKDHAIPISTALGELIEKQVQEISSLDYKEKYMFPRKENSPVRTNWYRRNMQKACAKWKIQNEDGTDYTFAPHAYRHTIATDLEENYNVDLEIIQLVVLGHSNIQMSLCYIDSSDEYKKMKNDLYVNSKGQTQLLDNDTLEQPAWIKKGFSKHVLPNGICGFPTALGVCPNSMVCLDCEYFRTSKRFLEVHKNQLNELEKNILIYEREGYLPNLETAKKQREILLRIIKTLEE